MLTLFLLALALATNTLAVSVSLGLSFKPSKNFHAIYSSASFGIFQGLMPFLAYLYIITLKDFVDTYSKWIAFILLFFIGAKMIYETHKEMKNNTEPKENKFSLKNIFILSITTSINAFASGISLAMLNVNIALTSLFISALTVMLCIYGFYFDKIVGSIFQHKAQIFGGIVLITIAFKSLIG